MTDQQPLDLISAELARVDDSVAELDPAVLADARARYGNHRDTHIENIYSTEAPRNLRLDAAAKIARWDPDNDTRRMAVNFLLNNDTYQKAHR